jgi:hypothetical protein
MLLDIKERAERMVRTKAPLRHFGTPPNIES